VVVRLYKGALPVKAVDVADALGADRTNGIAVQWLRRAAVAGLVKRVGHSQWVPVDTTEAKL